MDVVLIGTDRVTALLVRHPDVELVHRGGVQVEVGRLVVVAGLDQDVRAHVDEVGGARHGPGQVPRVGDGAREVVGRLHPVDVVVDGAGVVGVHLQSALDLLHEPEGAVVQGLPVIVPVVPAGGVHVRGRGEHLKFDVVGIRLRQGAGLLVVRLVERFALRRRILRIAGGKRLDHRLFLPGRRPGQLPGPADRLPGGLQLVLRRGALVQVGPVRERPTPVGHRVVVETRRLVEGTPRFRHPEGVHEPEPLIEVLLTQLRRAAHRITDRAELRVQRHRQVRGVRFLFFPGGRRGGAQQGQNDQQGSTSTGSGHLGKSPHSDRLR